jgi:hypothetical protein
MGRCRRTCRVALNSGCRIVIVLATRMMMFQVVWGLEAVIACFLVVFRNRWGFSQHWTETGKSKGLGTMNSVCV